MFGLLTPCRHTMPDELVAQWRAHLCGLCLSLRDNHGHASRLATNTDAVMLSVLVAAQRDTPPASTRAGRCPLRGMRSADVVAIGDPGVRLATGVSLTLAAGKAADVVEEQRRGLAPVSRTRRMVAGGVSGALRTRAVDDGAVARLLDVDSMLARLSGQALVESQSRDLDELTRASSEAASRVFAATADIACAPDNREHLAAMGADFGRLAHLIDAIDDLADDRERGTFNPLDASGTTVDDAHAECRLLVRAIARRYDALRLLDDRLLRAVLIDGVRHAVRRRTPHRVACAQHRPTDIGSTSPPDQQPRPDQQPPPPSDYPNGWPFPPPFRPNRPFHERVLPFMGNTCCGPACFANHWNHCSDTWKPALCDCDDCCECDDCCDCGDCCDSCDCGDCCSCN